MKDLFLPLKAEHYDSFADGSKRHERRVQGRGWNPGTVVPGRGIILSRGYGKKNRMYGTIISRRVVPFADIAIEHHAALIACYGEEVRAKSILEIEIYIEGVNR